MASLRQIAANRRNGRKGGPKTEAGKQRSRANSVKHGLTSSTLVVLPDEDEAEYQEVLRGFRESFNPQDDAEDALVLRLAHSHWRTLRSRRVETGMLAIGANTERARAQELVENCPEHLNAHNAIAVGFLTRSPEQWQAYLRYDTTISREFFRTLDALMKLQRANKPKPEPKPCFRAATAGSGPGPVLTRAAGAAAAVSEPRPQEAVSSTPAQNRARQQAAPVAESGIRFVSQTTLITNQQKEHNHESEEKNIVPIVPIHGPIRPALGCGQPVTNSTSRALDRFERKKGHIQRLLASARVLPRFARRAGQRNIRSVGGH